MFVFLLNDALNTLEVKMFFLFTGASQVAPVVKNPPVNAEDTRDMASDPQFGRSPEEGNGNPLQYS